MILLQKWYSSTEIQVQTVVFDRTLTEKPVVTDVIEDEGEVLKIWLLRGRCISTPASSS